MTRVFINGQEVQKEDLNKIEIKCDLINKIITEKCSDIFEKAS